MTAFKHRRHDTSLSDVNLFIDEPAAWFIKNFIGYRGSVGPAAHRGTSVEHGLNEMIGKGLDVEGAKRVALDKFWTLVSGEVTPESEKEANGIEAMVSNAAAEFERRWGFGDVLLQKRVEAEIGGLVVMGYLDFLLPDELIDLKTTMRAPSKPKPNHARQVSFYSVCEGVRPTLLYVTPSKTVAHTLTAEEVADNMRHVEAAIRAIARIRKGWHRYVELFPPRDLGSFYYDETSRGIAEELWNV